jgi:hypothetical protein
MVEADTWALVLAAGEGSGREFELVRPVDGMIRSNGG